MATALSMAAGVTKQVSADELPSHFAKTGTPTMGGLMFIGPIIALTLVLAITWLGEAGLDSVALDDLLVT